MKKQEKREAVDLAKSKGLSGKRGMKLVGIESSLYYYKAHPRDDSALASKLMAIANQEPRFGYRRAWFLIYREEPINRKRVYRVWRELNLCLPRKKKRKRKKTGKGIVMKAECPNHVWTYDFMFDSLSNGNRLKLLTVEDEYTREGLAIHVDKSIRSDDLICILADLFRQYGNPAYIRSDNGPEFIAGKLKNWLAQNGTDTLHIDAGSPWQNGFIESFNSKVRDEFLNMEIFYTLREAQVKTEMWRNKYNSFRPHMSLNYKTPMQERTDFYQGLCPRTPEV